MKKILVDFKEIYVKHRTLATLIVVLFVMSLVLFVYTIFNLKPNTSVIKVSYGDIGRYQGGEWSSMSNSGGYHDGAWQSMLVYPLFAGIIGVLHSVIAIRLFHKKGEPIARIFVFFSMLLILLVFLIFWRLLGEN